MLTVCGCAEKCGEERQEQGRRRRAHGRRRSAPRTAPRCGHGGAVTLRVRRPPIPGLGLEGASLAVMLRVPRPPIPGLKGGLPPPPAVMLRVLRPPILQVEKGGGDSSLPPPLPAP